MSQTLICDVQRFSVHDGPGIRTTVFFKGCPLRCKWCQNPETLRFENELVFSVNRCIACGDCEKACRHRAIIFNKGPNFVRKNCQACFACAEACPSRALEPAAREYAPEKLVEELLADSEFYEPEGGITLSGGEPFLQPAFLSELLPILKREKLHVAAETCGYFSWESLAPLLEMIDLILYDLKALDPDMHRALTGKDNRLIIENLRRLIDRGIPHQIRMPLIPGMNDSDGEIDRVSAFLRELKETGIWLLPYHRLGESKLKKIDSELKPLGLASYTESELRAKAAIFYRRNIAARTSNEVYGLQPGPEIDTGK